MAKKPRGRPFKPGTSGNPRGRPPAEICLTALLKAYLAEKEPDGKRTNARAIIEALGTVAKEGKTAAIQQIFDRNDGLLQPILEGPVLDLEAVARRMREKVTERAGITGGPALPDPERSGPVQ